MSEGYEQEQNTLEWESIEEKDILAELQAFNTNCIAATKQLNVMIVNNECKKTEEMLETFAYGDLAEGWLKSFHDANRDSFSKYINGNARPGWYSSLSLDQQKRYDMIMQYYRDTVTLLNPFSDLSRILLDLVDRKTLREGFRVAYMVFNFGDAGITENFYKKLDVDARQVSARINRDWGDAERMASSAKTFLENNRERMDYSSLKAGYQKARLQDYLDDFRNSVISDTFGVLSDGSFYVKADALSKARAIDKYTFALAQSEDAEDVMKKLIEECTAVMNKQLIPNEKDAKTEGCGNVFMLLRKLVQELINYAETVLESFKLYREANPDEAPYCFMKHPSAYDAVQPKYGFTPDRRDPWDGGTHYADLYVMEAVALTRHCEEFVRKRGNADLRD